MRWKISPEFSLRSTIWNWDWTGSDILWKKKIEHVNHILFKKIRKNVKKKKTKSVTHFYHRIILRIITESKNMITDYRISTRDIDSIVYLSGRIKTSVPYFWKKFALIQFLLGYNQLKHGHQEPSPGLGLSGPSKLPKNNGALSLKFSHTRNKFFGAFLYWA